ncbi:WXG100 family type VII secretion target [Actinoplanes sp. L3-i22]|uniref:WXG100 family type VII secretion target n=1 Tax=Actinoplanes sp. L3-i22 TaxID=2836373 RepID=UPI001C77EC96|nr:WXG100 family type VII secretion target [Actinoplanes sp. L3-i22]BCY07232.1 hypothetical protein L3i22_023200 [Actinoplanes sp. L3-i22]
MSDYSFNFTEASSVLASINTINGQIQSALDELENNVKSSLAEWTGAAQAEYETSKLAWQKYAGEMVTKLGTAQTTLSGIADNYGDVEKHHMNAWQNQR